MLEIGQKAPSFSLMDQHGEEVTLDSLQGTKTLIWFYPKASTPGCTAEGCGLQAEKPAFDSQGIQIVGVSMDSVKRQSNFATKQGFEYRLLADPEGEMVKEYGAWGRKKFMGREYDGILRISYLLDENGIVEQVYGKVKTKSHAADVLASL